MKKLLLAFACLPFFIQAQTFTNNTSMGIPDNNSEICFPVSVSGLPAQLDTSYGLTSVCINITHGWVGDLDVLLKSPNGTSIILTANFGGSGDNYTNTCFTMAATTAISQGTPPFSGNYIPVNSINIMNNGQNPNGTWQLCVTDNFAADMGVFNNVVLTFSSNPPDDPSSGGGGNGPCSLTNGAGCSCPDGSQNCDLLPDMTASGLIIQQQHTEYPGQLTLSNATPNIGWGPMEIHATNYCYCDTTQVPCSTSLCPDGSSPKQKLSQRVYRKSGSAISFFDTLTRASMSYHPSHGHIHVDNWAEFTLRSATSNPDATTWPILGSGSKVSFCLINLGDCSVDYGYCVDTSGSVVTMSDIPNSPFGLVNGCGLDQGIYTGMLDIYSQGMAGMSIDLTDVCNGNYYVVSITDPENNFLESNDNNNWTAVPITLTQQQPAPTANFNFTPFGTTYAFSANISNATSFVWDFGDGTTDTANNPTIHSYPSPGNYTVTLTVTSSCGTATYSQNLLITGMEQDPEFGKFMIDVFPNPSSGDLNINFYMNESGNAEISLYSIVGEKVKTITKGDFPSGKNIFKGEDLNGIKPGTYILKLNGPSGEVSKKIVFTGR